MSVSKSIAVEKRLLAQIQTEICCSKGRGTCDDDEFCSSRLEDWPVVGGSPGKTRLTYPPDKRKPSVPGVDKLAARYASWYARSGCGLLTKDIASFVPRRGKCVAGLNCDKAIEEIDEALRKRCPVMYEGAHGSGPFKPDRPDDLNNLLNFTQEIDQGTRRRFHWNTFATGGGVVGVLGLAGWAIVRVIRAIKSIGSGVRDIGAGMNWFAEGLEMITKSSRRLVTVSLPNFFRTARYIATLGWLRGKKPPAEIQAPPTAPAPPTQGAPTVPTPVLPEVNPHPDVVRVQLEDLAHSEHYAQEGKLYAEQDGVTKSYLAHRAIEVWRAETADARSFYMKDDHFLLEGKLPVGFLLKFARTYITERKLEMIRTAARVWGERLGIVAHALPTTESQRLAAASLDFAPSIEGVRSQLEKDTRFARAGRMLQDYLVRKAIWVWESLPAEGRRILTRDEPIPEASFLPKRFVRAFRRQQLKLQKELEVIAWAFEQMVSAYPALLTSAPFGIVDSRVKNILAAWEILPDVVKQEFTRQAWKEGEPGQGGPMAWPYIHYVEPVLKIGVVARSELVSAKHPWSFDAFPEEIYRCFSLRNLMEQLVIFDGRLVHYCDILKSRAMFVVDRWMDLSPILRSRFLSLNPGEVISERELPELFVDFAYRLIGNIALGQRGAIVFDARILNGDSGRHTPGGKGGGGASPGAPPATPPRGAPFVPDTSFAGAAASLSPGTPRVRARTTTQEFILEGGLMVPIEARGDVDAETVDEGEAVIYGTEEMVGDPIGTGVMSPVPYIVA